MNHTIPSEEMISRSPKLIVIIGVLFTSFSSIFVRSSDAPAIIIAMYRMWFSVVLLLPFLIHEQRKNRDTQNEPAPVLRDYILCVVSGVFLAFHFWTWFEALSLTSIASATVLVDTHPIFVLVLGFLILHEKVHKKSIIFVGITIAGMALLSFGDLAGGEDSFFGDMLALLGAAAVSGYLIIGRSVRQRMSASSYVVLVYLTAAITLTIIAAIGKVPLISYAGREYLIFLGMAFFCTLLGHTLFNWALKHLKTSFISMIILTEPLYATVFGIAIFGEIPAMSTIAGGVVILLGVFLFVREEGRTTQRS